MATEMKEMLTLINDEFLMNECKTFVENALRDGVGLNSICKVCKQYIQVYNDSINDPLTPNEFIRNTLTIEFFWLNSRKVASS